jgi:phage terminase small subunit
MSPLDYMLSVMRNPEADQARRDKMAIAAAPFVHGKPGETAKGKKEAAEDAAKTAGNGTEWGDDLRPSVN